jgi:histidine ammonia-lyase
MINLGEDRITLAEIEAIINHNVPIQISQKASQKLTRAYEVIKNVATSEVPVYGVNTGFGALAETRISPSEQENLQKNIILSHAVGVGPPLDFYVAKTLILLRLNTLIQAHSGASPLLISHLVTLLNANVVPYVPKKGSVGASGDLAPLAHLGLLCLGIGEALVDNQVVNAHLALERAGLGPLAFGLRDGLALINGTQAMAACGAIALLKAHELNDLADCAAASSLDALAGHITPFDSRIHKLKPYPGQIRTAKNIVALTKERTISHHIKNNFTQDPYSLRCVPQVHGASKEVWAHAHAVIMREINSVTDNPLFFFNDAMTTFESISGGNFHGQAIAFALDYLAMGVAELANIAERRIELMLNPHHSRGLPPFLIENSGQNSGFMMLQVTAAALVNENKVLCYPASVDSIPTSANREDHVSMGMTSANKLLEVIANTKTVLAIEMLSAHQAIDFRPSGSMGAGVQKLHESLRDVVPVRKFDVLFKNDLDAMTKWLECAETKQLIKSIIASNSE